MRSARVWFSVLACVLFGMSERGVTQAQYKLVEWPALPKSAAGFDAPWNFIQVSGVAISPKGTILVLHRGAHPTLEFDASG